MDHQRVDVLELGTLTDVQVLQYIKAASSS
jgi:hypothetical protein